MHKCHYCDFYSIVEPAGVGSEDSGSGRPGSQGVFVDRLIEELSVRSSQTRLHPETVFIGGGTPTLLEIKQWERLLEAMRQHVAMDGVKEFTVEANPETLSPELIGALANAGVNRISLGAQSFNRKLLKALERWHDPDHVKPGVQMARNGGIWNVNIDLIFAIPGQTMDMLDADLDAALALEPDHLSYYNLTYEPNTAMTKRLGLGRITPIDEQLEREMYARVIDRLSQAGYEHYEISNWAKPGRRCQHNLHYWTNANWIGLGPGAASHIDGYRWKNQPHLGKYLAHTPEPPTTDHEHLPKLRRIGEHLMLGLRLIDGVSHGWVKQNLPADDPRHDTIAGLIEQGLLERTDTHLRLTKRGLFVADAVVGELL